MNLGIPHPVLSSPISCSLSTDVLFSQKIVERKNENNKPRDTTANAREWGARRILGEKSKTSVDRLTPLHPGFRHPYPPTPWESHFLPSLLPRLRVVSNFGESGEIHAGARKWAPARRRAGAHFPARACISPE